MRPGTALGMTTHAAGYDRQSEERRNRSEASQSTQRTANRREVTSRADRGEDIVWVGHYSEKPGTSAFSGKERPEFERLLQDCRTGRVNMIVVMYVSRFSRADPLDAIPVVTELLNLGVTIVSTTEGEFRKGNLMDLIHIIMRLDQAHNESKNKSVAVKGAHDIARSLGGMVGKIPYGFYFVPTMVPNPADRNKPVVVQIPAVRITEAKVIRNVWATIKKHRDDVIAPKRGAKHPGSLTGICANLGAKGVPTRGQTGGGRTKGSAWDPVTLKRILSDPMLAGYQRDVVFKRDAEGLPTRSVEGYRIRRDSETMEPLTWDYEPIIPPDEWHELQEWLAGRGRGKGLYRGEYLLTGMGLLYCECGAPMVGHRSGKKTAYECKRRMALPGQHAGSVTIDTAMADDYVARRVFGLISTAEDDPATLAIIAEATKRFGKRAEAPQTAGERSALVKERADAVTALNELYEAVEEGGYSGPIGRRKMIELERKWNGRVEAAESRLAELDLTDGPALPIGEWLGDPDGDPIGEGSWWHGASVADKRSMLRLFVGRISVAKAPGGQRWGSSAAERVSVEWVQPDPDEDPDEWSAVA